MRITTFILALTFVFAGLSVACESKDGTGSEGGESGESGESAESGESGDDDKEARRAAYEAAEASMETFAEEWEATVVSNDVEAVKALWASPDELAGCMRTDVELMDGKQERVATDESWADEVAGNIEGMDSEYELMATKKHGETFRHRINVWRNDGINFAFAGECAVEFHGEIWFDALVEDDERAAGIRHRAYFAQLGDDWKLLDVIGPETVKCDNPADKGHAVCKKLRGEDVD